MAVAPFHALEPMLPSEGNHDLGDRVLDLVGKAQGLAGLLNPKVQLAVGDLVRSMNCYYSNLIEGHDTHPRDIDRALECDYSKEPRKRSLQMEAQAHIEVQRLIDQDAGPAVDPATCQYILWLHKAFVERLPDEMLWAINPDTGKRIKITPGKYRDGGVSVGRHIPPGPESLDGFLARFEEVYTGKGLSKSSRILAAAAAHHRLLWIHPFYDGNGRVARLMSYAMLRRLGVGSPIWSVARGLARSVSDYKGHLENADEPRTSDLDGRGQLSERALIEFCRFFLDVCIDQVDYMAALLQPAELLNRMRVYCAEEVAAKRLPKMGFSLLREALLAGEFERGRAAELTGYQERRARDTLSLLLKQGLLVANGPKMPVRLGFPIDVVERWFPLLYPGLKI